MLKLNSYLSKPNSKLYPIVSDGYSDQNGGRRFYEKDWAHFIGLNRHQVDFIRIPAQEVKVLFGSSNKIAPSKEETKMTFLDEIR